MTKIFFTVNNSPLASGPFNRLAEVLPVAMQLTAKKINHWQHRQAYVLGKLMLHHALQQLQPGLNLAQLNYTGYGRPYFDGRLDFNISHSGDYVTCIISDEGRVGIDIEKIQAVDINAYKNQFNADEWQQVVEAWRNGHYRLFYRYWTLKEAAVKADGRGMYIPLKEVNIHKEYVQVGGTPWFFKQQYLAENYVAHIASSKKIVLPLIWQAFTACCLHTMLAAPGQRHR
jgi:4'-phosphopantetheinyl transferase